MEAIRAFIAIELPDEMRQKLGQVIRSLQERSVAIGGEAARKAVRWVPPENIHLTLKFLGEVSAANVQVLARMLKSEASRHKPFELGFGGTGAFPNLRRPRVLWVGSGGSPVLNALQHAVENETRALGYPTEERPFSPHLTLGRVAQQAGPGEVAALSQALTTVEVGDLGTVTVDRIHLFRSDLRPSGAVYTSLYAFPFGSVSSGHASEY